MTPDEQHAAVLAALAELEAMVAAATPAPWRWTTNATPDDGFQTGGPDLMAGDETVLDAWGHGVWGLNVDPADQAVIVALRNTAAAVVAGRRRILERHTPHDYTAIGLGHVCGHCTDPDHPDMHPSWPCDDWSDAAAGLLPEETL